MYHRHVVCITLSLKLSSSPSVDSHGAATVAHQVLPYVTAADGASVYACECVLCSVWERRHNPKRSGRTLWRGQGNTNPHTYITGDFPSNRDARLRQQQRYNSSTTPPAPQSLAFMAATSRLCSTYMFRRCVLYMHSIMITSIYVQYRRQVYLVTFGQKLVHTTYSNEVDNARHKRGFWRREPKQNQTTLYASTAVANMRRPKPSQFLYGPLCSLTT